MNSRAVSLREELASKAAALSDTQQQLKRTEQDAASLKVNVEKVTEEHAKLDKKAQSLAGDLQKAQQEKETQKKELISAQENLGKSKKALKETQSLLDTERKNHKATMEEKVMMWRLHFFSLFVPFLSLHLLHFIGLKYFSNFRKSQVKRANRNFSRI